MNALMRLWYWLTRRWVTLRFEFQPHTHSTYGITLSFGVFDTGPWTGRWHVMLMLSWGKGRYSLSRWYVVPLRKRQRLLRLSHDQRMMWYASWP